MNETRGLQGYLRKRGITDEDARDIICEGIVRTWEHLIAGRVRLPTEPAEYGPALGKYLVGVVKNLVANRRRAGEMMVRGSRADIEPEQANAGAQRIEAAIELASELHAQPLNLRRFLLAFLTAGEIAETAKRLRMTESAAEDAFRRAREHAQGIRRPPRRPRRPKK